MVGAATPEIGSYQRCVVGGGRNASDPQRPLDPSGGNARGPYGCKRGGALSPRSKGAGSLPEVTGGKDNNGDEEQKDPWSPRFSLVGPGLHHFRPDDWRVRCDSRRRQAAHL